MSLENGLCDPSPPLVKTRDETLTEKTETSSSVSDEEVVPVVKSASSDFLLVGELSSASSPKKRDEPLSTDIAPDGMLTVHSVLPEGITIGHGPFGRCLIATNYFPEGSFIYRGCAFLVKSEHDSHRSDLGEHLLHVYDKNGETCVESFTVTTVHSVEDYAAQDVRRQVYGFDGFMNHSCDPNCYCPLETRLPDRMWYTAIALRDITPGDEITCDYACFDYKCDGHEIPVCGCKAANCRGSMLGFQGLSLEEKVRIMHLCEQEVVEKFLEENPNVVVLHSSLPEGVAVRYAVDDTYLTATLPYEPGEVIFSNHATIVPHTDLNKIFILEVGNRYTLLDPQHHFIHRKNFCENIGFDCFMDHSCDPNTTQRYNDGSSYVVIATRPIGPGEKITCDYGTLQNQANMEESIATTSFQCKCGADKCRGVIVA